MKPMSDPVRPTRLAPTPSEPVKGAVAPLDAVTFRWTAPPGASVFDLRVAMASAPDAPVVELEGLPTTETTLADVLPDGDALWWVRTSGGAWSAPARFRAGTPADVEAARAAETVAARAAPASRKKDRTPGAVGPAGAPPDPLWPHAEGEGLDDTRPLDWSTVPGFGAPSADDRPTADEPAPRPLGPLGGEVVDAVIVSLRWATVRGATGYEVQLSPHVAFDRDVLALDVGGATELSLSGLVPPAGRKLLWRVRALVGDAATPWSRYGRFYPAAEAAVERFGTGLHAAQQAERKQLDHARQLAERERDQLPFYQRDEAVSTAATFGVLIGMALSGIVIGLLALVATYIHFGGG